MKVEKALKKAFNANVKILTQKAILAIKQECIDGNYHAKIDLLEDDLKSRPTFKINKELINNLEVLGYRIGSRVHAEGKYYVNVFWDETKSNNEDFASS